MSNAAATMSPSSDYAQTRKAAQLFVPSALWRAAVNAAQRIAAWRARRRRIRRTVAALSGLSNRMLRDIGIEPGEIEQHAARICS